MKGKIQQILGHLSQLRYPVELRISPPVWGGDLTELIAKLQAAAMPIQAGAPPPKIEESNKERLAFLADIGTGLWRLRQKMVEPETDRPLEEMRRPFRHLESTWDVLIQAGLEIQDHTGLPYDSGMALKAVAFQPTAGVGREKICETIKPTIYYKSLQIQMGEVIVAVPPGNAQ